MKTNQFKKYRENIFSKLQIESNKNESISILNRFLIGLILASVISTVLETEIIIRQAMPSLFIYLNIIFIVLFSIEYMLRFWACKESKLYSGKL